MFTEMSKNALKNHPPWLEKILRFALLKWLKYAQIMKFRPGLRSVEMIMKA